MQRNIEYLIAMLPPEKHEAVKERSAIMQYMGRMTREEADEAAWNEFTKIEVSK